MDIFVALPDESQVEFTSIQLMLSALLLMKVAGQVAVSSADMRSLARDYSGYTVQFDKKTETFTFTLKVRHSENPPFELAPKG